MTALNLEFLIADILEEQRNPAFTTFKKMTFYRVNKPFKDSTRQNKGFKYTENFRPSNCYKKLDKGSSYNIYLKDDEEAFKNAETKLESDLDLELESFIYIIRNFDLDDSKSSCFIGSSSFRNSVEDFEIEGGYLVAFNKVKKLLKRLSNRLDLSLYDIGTIDYIVNDRKWFKDDYAFNKDQLKTLKIGRGLVILKGSSTVIFIVLF